MACRHRRRLVLVSRSRDAPRRRPGRLRAAGAASCRRADVATRDGVRAALAAVERSACPCEESCTPPARSTTRSSRSWSPIGSAAFSPQGARRLASARADPLRGSISSSSIPSRRRSARSARRITRRQSYARCDRRPAPIPGAAGADDRIGSDRRDRLPRAAADVARFVAVRDQPDPGQGCARRPRRTAGVRSRSIVYADVRCRPCAR